MVPAPITAAFGTGPTLMSATPAPATPVEPASVPPAAPPVAPASVVRPPAAPPLALDPPAPAPPLALDPPAPAFIDTGDLLTPHAAAAIQRMTASRESARPYPEEVVAMGPYECSLGPGETHSAGGARRGRAR